jgi:GrpB-like predicted nucleotidyltransferase (UPF0157 family)
LFHNTVEWKRLYEEERAIMQAAVGDYILNIQHVDSTPIPGMIAKPIIDVAIAVKNDSAMFSL